jgi:type VI secretion system protein ImpH
MATPGRRADPALDEALRTEPFRFEFFQAVRLLRALGDGRAPVGRDNPPALEIVRFHARAGLIFPPSAIHRIEPAAAARPPSMTVSFLGLTGPSGVLPHVYSDLVQARARLGDSALGEFLDLFNHRLISLFYRAWEKHRVAVASEQGGDDQFAGHVFALIGLGLKTLRGRHDFSDAALLTYAGFFARRHRPAVVLEDLLRDHFGIAVEVVQFSGQWLKLDPGDRSAAGRTGRHNRLGVDVVIGSRVWDEQGKVRLRLGPLGFEAFRDYLPDGPSFRPLVQMARLFLDAEFDVDVQLVLKTDEVPACRLSSRPGAGARLGRFAWLRSRPLPHDVDDAVFAAKL